MEKKMREFFFNIPNFFKKNPKVFVWENSPKFQSHRIEKEKRMINFRKIDVNSQQKWFVCFKKL